MSWYLKEIKAEHFGGLEFKELGTLKPGLNVVFGPNEAGKTTFATLVGSVLFGWIHGHGVQNTYRPPVGERSGSLVFSATDSEMERFIARRGSELILGEEGESASLIGDIDQSTFATMFSLTSDELRSLRDSSDVAARLLSAGSGTAASPSAAFVEIEQRIAAHTATTPEDQDSVLELGRRLEEQRDQVQRAVETVEESKQKGRELRELTDRKADIAQRLDALNEEIEELSFQRSTLATMDERLGKDEADLVALDEERQNLMDGKEESVTDPRLLSLDSAGERTLEDRLDEFAEEQGKARRILETAKENSAASMAAYEAFLEMEETPTSHRERLRSRTSHGIISIIPTLVFIAAGIPLFIHGRQINSLSFTVLGIALVLFAFLLGVGAMVGLLRPGRDATAIANRRQDAQWVMLQDKKKLDGSKEECDRLDEEIATFLEQAGLGRAEGSLRRARVILEEAREERNRRQANDQRLSAIELRKQALQQEVEDARRQRRTIEEALELAQGAPLRSVDELMRVRVEQRTALQEVGEDTSRRIGELSAELEQAESDHSFDALKMEYHRTLIRLRESKHELITLLLARRMLEHSIAAWESHNQPEVYDEASRLFSLITDGCWSSVTMAADGGIVAIDHEGVTSKPRHLSLGTCQQLYLVLRVSLLEVAQDVGRAIPVLADDILVNFDAARRQGAAQVLAELARKRQVIVFTCHQETVDALLAADADGNLLEL